MTGVGEEDASYAVFAKDRRTTVSDGTTIAYTVRGDGTRTPAVFANGWSCSDAYWAFLVPALIERGHPCVIPDTRGNGLSGLPRPPGRGAKDLLPGDMSVARMGRDLVEVLDHAGVERAVFIGHSMGVQTMLESYRHAPERAVALVAVAGPYENPLHTFYGVSLVHHIFPLAYAVVRNAPELLRPLWSGIRHVHFGHAAARFLRAAGPKSTVEAMAPYLLHMATRDPAVLMEAVAAMRTHSAADLLPHISVPTLILAATLDTFTPPRGQKRMHELVPGSEIVWFDEAGHTLPIEEPDAIAAAIDDFLTRRVEDDDGLAA